MQNYRKTSHSTYDCKYHIVWITKYCKIVLSGLIAERIRELIRGICKEHEVETIISLRIGEVFYYSLLCGCATNFSTKLQNAC